MCTHFEIFHNSVHSLSLRCAIEIIVSSYWALFRFDKISDFYYYQLTILSFSKKRRFCLGRKIGDVVSFTKTAILSCFQNRWFCLTLKIGSFVPSKKRRYCVASLSCLCAESDKQLQRQEFQITTCWTCSWDTSGMHLLTVTHSC